ncbi:MAG: hypothetical protein HY744_11225 [Deltaproteobacteria bacterium]|nr:hypothetical protein [Deltaproteobacteria bacterium]
MMVGKVGRLLRGAAALCLVAGLVAASACQSNVGVGTTAVTGGDGAGGPGGAGTAGGGQGGATSASGGAGIPTGGSGGGGTDCHAQDCPTGFVCTDGACVDQPEAAWSAELNPTGNWTWGWMAADDDTFHVYPDTAVYGVIVDWHDAQVGELPAVGFNPTSEAVVSSDTLVLGPHSIAFHPGPSGERSVMRWTARQSASYRLEATFTGLSGYNDAPVTTTAVAVRRGDKELKKLGINVDGGGNEGSFAADLDLAQGEMLDFIVDWGDALALPEPSLIPSA